MQNVFSCTEHVECSWHRAYSHTSDPTCSSVNLLCFHLLLQLSLWTRRAETSGFNLLPVPTWEDLEQNPFSKPQNIPLLFNFEKLHGKCSVLCLFVLAVQCASVCMRELPVWWWCAHVQELPVLFVRCLLFTCAQTAYLVEVFIEYTRTYEASFLLINNVVYMSVLSCCLSCCVGVHCLFSDMAVDCDSETMYSLVHNILMK